MEQKTYEQVLASIDREQAARAIANCVIYLGGLNDWGSDEFAAVQEQLAAAIAGAGLPDFGNQDDDAFKFWGTLSLDAGNDCDYEPRTTPRYVATITTPGYLPMDDDPPVFDTAAEAWAYLAEERKHAEDSYAGDGWPRRGQQVTVTATGRVGTVDNRDGDEVRVEFADLDGVIWFPSEQLTWDTEYTGTLTALRELADPRRELVPFTVYGDTPGYDGEHDLGLAYSVSIVEED